MTASTVTVGKKDAPIYGKEKTGPMIYVPVLDLADMFHSQNSRCRIWWLTKSYEMVALEMIYI